MPIAAFFPAAILATLIWQNAVNIPCWDDWEKAHWLAQWKTGTFGLAELYAPHIEHRIVFPRLIILALGSLTQGDVRWELAITFLWTLAGAVALAALARRYLPLRPACLWTTVFLVNLILFSPIQWDNWLWGIQLAFMMPMACLCIAFYFALKPGPWWRHFLPTALFALIGTHSFGHGMVVWPAVFGLVLLHPDAAVGRSERTKFLVAWAILGTLTIGCYFGVSFENASHNTHAYGQGPGDIPPALSATNHLFDGLSTKVHFFFTALGNPLSRIAAVPPFVVAAWFGVPLLAFFSVAAFRFLTASPEVRRQALPWLALGGAAILGILAVTLARADVVGVKRATSIRYASIAGYLWIAAVLLSSIRRSHPSMDQRSHHPRPLVWMLVGLMLPLWLRGADAMSQFKEARLQEKAAVLFINHWDPDCISRIDATVEVARTAANILDQYGWIHPPLVKDLAIEQFKPLDKPRPYSSAKVDLIRCGGPSGCIEVGGYARLPDRPADAVLLTSEQPGLDPRIFACSGPSTELPALADRNDMELLGRSPDQPSDWWTWSTTFSHQALCRHKTDTSGPFIIKAWMFDVLKMRAYRIAGTWQIDSNGQLTALDEAGTLALTPTVNPPAALGSN